MFPISRKHETEVSTRPTGHVVTSRAYDRDSGALPRDALERVPSAQSSPYSVCPRMRSACGFSRLGRWDPRNAEAATQIGESVSGRPLSPRIPSPIQPKGQINDVTEEALAERRTEHASACRIDDSRRFPMAASDRDSLPASGPPTATR